MTLKEFMRIVRYLAIEKAWQLSLVQSLYSLLITIPLLLLANSDKLTEWLPWVNTKSLLLIGTPVLIIIGVIGGVFLDKVVKYQDALSDVANKRNPQLMEILERVKNIERKLEDSNETIK